MTVGFYAATGSPRVASGHSGTWTRALAEIFTQRLLMAMAYGPGEAVR
jgi:hypothetical protein